MARPLAQRLLIRADQRILVLDAPSRYIDSLDPRPDGVVVDTEPAHGVRYDGVHLFAADQDAVARGTPRALSALRDGGVLWIAYPKLSGPVHSDLKRDRGWEPLVSVGWDGIAQVSVDDTWSAMRFRPTEDVTYTPGSTRRPPASRRALREQASDRRLRGV